MLKRTRKQGSRVFDSSCLSEHLTVLSEHKSSSTKVVNRSRWLNVKLNQWKADWWPDWGRRQTEEGQLKQKHRGRVGIEMGGLVILLGNRDESSASADRGKKAWNREPEKEKR